MTVDGRVTFALQKLKQFCFQQYYPSPGPVSVYKYEKNYAEVEAINHLDIPDVYNYKDASQFSCPEPNGYFPVPGSCENYFHCSHGVSAILSCGDHLGWNHRTLSCDWKSNLNC